MLNKLKNIKIIVLAALIGLSACGDWLDVVPEGVATIDMAFNSREQALKYLATCYSYMPQNGNPGSDPAMLGGDELWTDIEPSQYFFPWTGVYYAQGMQNATEPLFDFWGSLYQALRDCNIFLDNVGLVPDLPENERDQWIAEVKVLKAYYHFYLVQMYGPIPLIRKNIPIDVSVSDVRVVREPVDDCFQYIVDLLDEAIQCEFLQMEVMNVAQELGRVTKTIALALKAKVLVTAASPLFNGNSEQAALRNKAPDGRQLFNTTPDPAKWQKAVAACKAAIAACDNIGMELYKYQQSVGRMNDTIKHQLTLREAFTKRWNSEIIWANTQSVCTGGITGMQTYTMANLYGGVNTTVRSRLGIPVKMASMFYTDNGVPLAEDNTRDVTDQYRLREGKSVEKLYIKTGYTTLDIHFDREPRFYAYVAFDGGIWYGQGKTDEKNEGDLWTFETRKEGAHHWANTGYLPKKIIPHTNMISDAGTPPSSTPYPWPIIRLSDLYLFYAEAINEAEGPNGPNSAELFKYINLVRERAGLDGVEKSWDDYTDNKKYREQSGMREIIQQERTIELCFEGHRFWDVRRWKTAYRVYHNNTVEGWNYAEADPAAYYIPMTLYTQRFGSRDYFWPLRNSDIINNPDLVQNLGW